MTARSEILIQTAHVEVVLADGLAELTLNVADREVNVLSAPVLAELKEVLAGLHQNTRIKAMLFLSAKKGIFIAGADIKEIENIKDAASARKIVAAGQDILNQIEDLPFPTIAVINGAAVGGGLELALCCAYRVAAIDPAVRLGLPEVKLGILPGFGGTWRLPRVIGLEPALKMILKGELADVRQASKRGLIDAGFLPANLIEEARRFAKNGMAKNGGVRAPKAGPPAFLKPFILGQCLKPIEARMLRQYPAVRSAAETTIKNFGLSRTQALKNEVEAFAALVAAGNPQGLIKAFFLNEQYKKETFQLPVLKAEFSQCGVVGAGIMGGGIAQILSSIDIRVRMKDVQPQSLSLGLSAAQAVYRKAVSKRVWNASEAETKFGLILPSLDYSGFKNCECVIEAVLEDLAVKQKVFAELEAVTGPQTLLLSNTSALSITQIASQVKDRSRVAGMHFFNPVHKMPLVEVVRGKETSDETLARVVALTRKLKKVPVVVADSCGFVVNRLLVPYLNEAGYLAEEGYAVEEMDRRLMDFGMPMGAFVLLDEIGLDVAEKVGKTLHAAFGERMKPPELIHSVLEAGFKGRKSQQGFYDYRVKKLTLNPAAQQIISQKSAQRGGSGLDPDSVVNRCLFVMINEAFRCLDERVCQKAQDIDVAMMMGAGFPPFRGGLLSYAESIGFKKIHEGLKSFEQKLQSERFTPCLGLEERMRSSAPIYGRE